MFRKLFVSTLAAIFSVLPLIQPHATMAMPKATAPSGGATATGTIVETMNASGYTYMLVSDGATETWVAVPETSVKKGTTVSYYEGMVMNNFSSKTLNRTFESVVFSSGLADEKKAEQQDRPISDDSFSAAVMAERSQALPKTPMSASSGSAGAIVPLKEISIEKADAANGYTVGEIFEKAKELSGKKVQVHAKVVKFNPMIMGKNWIHLQDGTGDPMQNSHDLVVTTGETVEINAIITIEGILTAEKDFGAGYKYAAIVEDATINK